MTPFEQGESLGSALFTLFILVCSAWTAVRGWRAPTASRRYADLSIALGLLVLIQPAIVFKNLWSPPLWSLMTTGFLRCLLAVAAVGLAVVAGIAKRDGGIGRGRVAMAMVLASWLGLQGISEIIAPTLVAATKRAESKHMAEGGARGRKIVTDARETWERATQALVDAGGISASSIATLEALDARLALVDNAIEATDSYRALMVATPPQVTEYFRRSGVEEKSIGEFEQGYLSAKLVKDSAEYLLAFTGLLKSQRDLLELMKVSWGHWRYDQEAQAVRLADHPSVQPWKEKAKVVEELGAKLKALELEIQPAQGPSGP